MRIARFRNPPRNSALFRTPVGAAGISDIATILWSKPVPLPRPWFFSEIVDFATVRDSARRYAAAVDRDEKNYSFRHGHVSVLMAQEHLVEAAFEAWIRACGARSEKDGREIANINYQTKWQTAARRLISRHLLDPRAVRNDYRKFKLAIIPALASSRRKDAVRDYLADFVLPYFDETVGRKHLAGRSETDEPSLMLRCRAAGGKELVDAWRDVLKDLIASL